MIDQLSRPQVNFLGMPAPKPPYSGPHFPATAVAGARVKLKSKTVEMRHEFIIGRLVSQDGKVTGIRPKGEEHKLYRADDWTLEEATAPRVPLPKADGIYTLASQREALLRGQTARLYRKLGTTWYANAVGVGTSPWQMVSQRSMESIVSGEERLVPLIPGRA